MSETSIRSGEGKMAVKKPTMQRNRMMDCHVATEDPKKFAKPPKRLRYAYISVDTDWLTLEASRKLHKFLGEAIEWMEDE